MISENTGDTLSSYDEVGSHDNFSDHSTVKCVLAVKVMHANRTSPGRDNNCRPAFSNASDDQLYAYKSRLNEYLCNITIPIEVMLCNNKMCKVHHKDICDYHDVIIMCMINACKEIIQRPKHVNNDKLLYLGALREESSQTNVILQYTLLTAILSAVCSVIQQS